MHHKLSTKIGLFFIGFSFLNFNLQAQSLSEPVASSGSDNSPYNQFGIGTLAGSPNAFLRGMSGFGAAYNDGESVNPENAASYSFLRNTTFSAAFEGRNRSVAYDGKAAKSSFTGNMAYLNIAFPIKNLGGVALGLQPVSNIYYRLVDTINLNTSDRAARTFYGDGGLQKAFAGFSGKYKNFSVGLNAGYIFGSITNIQNYSSTSLSSIRNFEDMYTTTYRGWGFNFGLLYQLKMKNEQYLNMGITYNNGATLNGIRNGNSITRTYGYSSTLGTPIVINLDTLRQFNDTKGDIVLPSSHLFGIHYGKYNKFDINLDVKYSNWTKFKKFGATDSIRSRTFDVGVGGTYTPNIKALYDGKGSYFSAVTYSAGFYFKQDPVYLRNTDILDIGGSLGFSFPLKRVSGNYQVGKIHTILQAGSRGTVANGLAKETYINFTIGASLSDLWFIKPVYD